MNMIAAIAWKNIWRNRARSLVVLISIALGMTGGIFSAAVMQGTSNQRLREAISRETANLQIHHPDYPEDKDVRFFFHADSNALATFLDTTPAVRSWSPRIRFMAMASSAAAGSGVMVSGVDPEMEKRVTDLSSLIPDSTGTWFGDGKGVPVVIGASLAKKLKVRLRSKIVLTFQEMHGELSGAAFRITGIYRTNNSVFDEMNIFVTREAIIPLLGAEPGTVHEIAIRLRDEKSSDILKTNLKTKFPELLTRDWKELDPILGMMHNLLDLWLYLFMGIILLALGFGIVNTMLMSIMERTRELGMLAAIGMNRRRIFTMIMFESVFLSLTGGLAGMALSIGLISWTGHTGIYLGSFSVGFEKMGYSSMLYPSLDALFFINITLMVIFTGIVASIYPARRALRLNPALAIRNE